MIEINTTVAVLFMAALVLILVLWIQWNTYGRKKEKVRLPVIQECGTCEFFDLQAGQDAMAHHPAFAQATAHLSPHAMTRTVDHDDAGGVIPPMTEFDAGWGDLGACHKIEEGVFSHSDKCPKDAYQQASSAILDRRERKAAALRGM